jgi:hypothetical protein
LFSLAGRQFAPCAVKNGDAQRRREARDFLLPVGEQAGGNDDQRLGLRQRAVVAQLLQRGDDL